VKVNDEMKYVYVLSKAVTNAGVQIINDVLSVKMCLPPMKIPCFIMLV
jgi:hypothetical protein